MNKIISFLRRLGGSGLLGRAASTNRDDSVSITDPVVISRFKADPVATYLVSFPRTGSHWLRMMMELYFERPSLVRVFFYPERTDYLTLHTHDLDLDVVRSRVIYLYRDPVATIFSQLRYHKESPDDLERIQYWSNLYGQHLNKWLFEEDFTEQKSVVRYESLKRSLTDEFEKICNHFGTRLDRERLKDVATRVSKERVKEKTTHDPQVINLNQAYSKERQRFRAQYSDQVWGVLLDGRQHLVTAFD